MVKVLIITSYDPYEPSEQQATVRSFVDQLNGEAVSAAVCSVHELIFQVANKQAKILLNGKKLKDYADVLFIRNMGSFLDYATTIRLYAAQNGMRLVNEDDVKVPFYGKVSQGFLFTYENIPTPDLISSTMNRTLQTAVETAELQYPMIVKLNEASKGQHNYLVHSGTELESILSESQQGFVAQPFISNSGEIRYLTFGNRQPIIFHKRANTGSHLNNTSQGGAVELMAREEVNEEIRAHAEKASRVTGRQLGGVDVLLADDGSHYILEVNSTPALASGAFQDVKIAAFIDYVLKPEVTP